VTRREPYSAPLLFDHAFTGDLQNNSGRGRKGRRWLVHHPMASSRYTSHLQPGDVSDLHGSID
jgi:hypothetical protein